MVVRPITRPTRVVAQIGSKCTHRQFRPPSTRNSRPRQRVTLFHQQRIPSQGLDVPMELERWTAAMGRRTASEIFGPLWRTWTVSASVTAAQDDVAKAVHVVEVPFGPAEESGDGREPGCPFPQTLCCLIYTDRQTQSVGAGQKTRG